MCRISSYKVYGLGDLYAPKNVSLQEDQRYQNVRIIAVYDTNQIPRYGVDARKELSKQRRVMRTSRNKVSEFRFQPTRGLLKISESSVDIL